MCMNLTMQWNDQELLQYLLPWTLNAGNPLEEKHSTEGDWRDQALKCLTKLKKLDGVPVVGQEEEEEEQ